MGASDFTGGGGGNTLPPTRGADSLLSVTGSPGKPRKREPKMHGGPNRAGKPNELNFANIFGGKGGPQGLSGFSVLPAVSMRGGASPFGGKFGGSRVMPQARRQRPMAAMVGRGPTGRNRAV